MPFEGIFGFGWCNYCEVRDLDGGMTSWVGSRLLRSGVYAY